jgi:hypothetical protein
VENEADLVSERRTATGAIGGELRLVQLDQILGLAARAIQAVVDPLGRADIEAGNDEADVEAELGRLNTGDGSPFAIPRLGLVECLGIAAQNSQVLDGASRADVVGDLVDFSGKVRPVPQPPGSRIGAALFSCVAACNALGSARG